MVTCGEEPGAGLAAKWVSISNVTCGKEPGAGLAAKWVSINNGYTWEGVWGLIGC